MKFDLHCHTRNGSLDSNVALEDYIRILRRKGFGGMLITDHNTYNGYCYWQELKKHTHEFDDFVVLKGIEYDTLDAGHFLVIMPEEVSLRILEVRGMRLWTLVETVHAFGGILGPAHPYGAKSYSLRHAKFMQTAEYMAGSFDFVEAFNTCETKESNYKARALAERHRLTCFGGSDSHKALYVGTAYTEVEYPVTSQNDFLEAVRTGCVAACGGIEREERSKYRKLIPMSTAFRVYNQTMGLVKAYSRRHNLRELYQQ